MRSGLARRFRVFRVWPACSSRWPLRWLRCRRRRLRPSRSRNSTRSPTPPASGTSAGGWTSRSFATAWIRATPTGRWPAPSPTPSRRALLLEPKRYVVESDIVVEDITKVYAIMLEHCDIHMGFKLIPEGYPNWVTLTPAVLRDPVRLRHRRPRPPRARRPAARAPDRRDGRDFGAHPAGLLPHRAARGRPLADLPDGHQRARPGVASQRHGRRRPRLGARASGPSSATTPPTPTFT